MSADEGNTKLTASICVLLLGGLGVHKFVLGYSNEGVIMLVLSVFGGAFTCGGSSGLIALIGFCEGLIYLTKSDEEFKRLYIDGRKPWF